MQHPGISEKGFLAPAWLRKRYAISNSTMYKWIAEGRLPRPVKIGPRAVRFRAEDIELFEEKFATCDRGDG